MQTLRILLTTLCLLALVGCDSGTEPGGGDDGVWWPQAVGWLWTYNATLLVDDTPIEFEMPWEIAGEETVGDADCFVNEIGNYDAGEGSLIYLHPVSGSELELWRIETWEVDEADQAHQVTVIFSDPATFFISGEPDDPRSDAGSGTYYLDGAEMGSGPVMTVVSETLEMDDEVTAGGTDYTGLRRVKFTITTYAEGLPDTQVSYVWFGDGIGPVLAQDFFNFEELELLEYQAPQK